MESKIVSYFVKQDLKELKRTLKWIVIVFTLLLVTFYCIDIYNALKIYFTSKRYDIEPNSFSSFLSIQRSYNLYCLMSLIAIIIPIITISREYTNSKSMYVIERLPHSPINYYIAKLITPFCTILILYVILVVVTRVAYFSYIALIPKEVVISDPNFYKCFYANWGEFNYLTWIVPLNLPIYFVPIFATILLLPHIGINFAIGTHCGKAGIIPLVLSIVSLIVHSMAFVQISTFNFDNILLGIYLILTVANIICSGYFFAKRKLI